MKTEALSQTTESPATTSLAPKMLNIFVSPGEVFEELASQPPRLAIWLIPTMLVCLVATAFTQPAISAHQVGSAAPVSARAQLAGAADACAGVFIGTFWSALVLWLIGRFILKTRFNFWKAVEVGALAGPILILSAVVTGLLATVSGNAHARPALSLLIGSAVVKPAVYAILDALDLFRIWTSVVLAIGLSKLTGVSLKECAFWVFAYWLLGRILTVLLQ